MRRALLVLAFVAACGSSTANKAAAPGAASASASGAPMSSEDIASAAAVRSHPPMSKNVGGFALGTTLDDAKGACDSTGGKSGSLDPKFGASFCCDRTPAVMDFEVGNVCAIACPKTGKVCSIVILVTGPKMARREFVDVAKLLGDKYGDPDDHSPAPDAVAPQCKQEGGANSTATWIFRDAAGAGAGIIDLTYECRASGQDTLLLSYDDPDGVAAIHALMSRRNAL